ncbi:MAG: hypothetical protein HUU50_16815 [Candidatus Brocadiae bacterium]|nr:hypothetical protein [Candidatus Brocadiia bacterium]
MPKKIIFLLFAISVSIWALPLQDVTWTQGVNVTISGNNLSCLSSNTWNSGAFSTQFIAANTDGFVQATVQETNTHRMLGLSWSNEDAYWSTIDYALYLVSNAQIYVYENGAGRGYFTGYATGDVVGIKRIGSTVSYYKNDVVFYTSTVTHSGILYADASLYEYGSTLKNVQISGVPEISSLACLALALGMVFIKKRIF